MLTANARSFCLLVRKVCQKLLGLVYACGRIELLRTTCNHDGMHLKDQEVGLVPVAHSAYVAGSRLNTPPGRLLVAGDGKQRVLGRHTATRTLRFSSRTSSWASMRFFAAALC